MIDELQLFRGRDYKLNEYITLHQPTLNEICDYGEEKYFNMVSTLIATPSDYKVQLLDNLNMDYEQISEFDFFIMMSRNLSEKETGILIKGIDLTKFEPAFNEQTQKTVLYDIELDVVIDEVLYIQIVDYIRKIHNFTKKTDKAGNEHTKKYLLEKERRQLKRRKNQKFKSMLVPLVSAMTNCEQFKYNHDTVWDLHIYTFNDCVQRIQKIKNYNQVMQGYYTGNIDISKISQSELNWLGSLE